VLVSLTDAVLALDGVGVDGAVGGDVGLTVGDGVGEAVAV
jgi:hypothetical protein